MTIISSFDVFETILARIVGQPEAVFLLLGRRAAELSSIDCTPEVFARARKQAEERVVRNRGLIFTLGHI